MHYKNFFIFILFISIIFSVNIIAANEINTTTDSLESNIISDENPIEISEEDYISQDDSQKVISSENDVRVSNFQTNTILSSSDNVTIHVGKNTTKDGDGSPENPFATFSLASDSINEVKNNVIINVDEGVYYLDSPLLFNVNNLHIIGMSENVCIKYRESSQLQYFTLSSANGNFTMTNIIVDVSSKPAVNIGGDFKFNIYKGDANLVTFNNCTFKNFLELLPYELDENDNSLLTEPYVFNNCKFIYDKQAITYYMIGVADRDVSFNYCLFDFKYNYQHPGMDSLTFSAGYSGKLTGHNTFFNNCWFGSNSLPSVFRDNGQEDEGYDINRYAIFSIYENYLGNNIYEIIGKLTWSDDTDGGFENFDPMTVTLSADNDGLSQKTVILKNGTFKVMYASSAANHKITATLDNQPVSIEFQSINITLDSPSISYGDKQNITVTLPNEYNGMIYVTVNNKTYSKEVEYTNVITLDITDVLPVATHEVNVTFIDDETPSAHTYAFNTTKINVNKVIPNVNISREGELVPGEKLIIKVEIPNATENVTIIVNGDKNITRLVDNVAKYTIDNLVAGTYYITVLYNGDNNFNFAYETDSFDVVKSTQELIKDLNDTVNAQAGTIVNQTKQISDLNSTVNAQSSTIDSQKTIINNLKNGVSKKSTKLTAPKKTFKVKTKTKKIKIKLTTGKTALKNKKITLKVKGKTYTATTNKKGIATFKITKLTKKGTFKYTVKFAGDNTYKAVSKNGKLKIK